MESWIVMGVAILIIGVVYPPFFGAVLGAGIVMGITIVAHKALGG